MRAHQQLQAPLKYSRCITRFTHHHLVIDGTIGNGEGHGRLYTDQRKEFWTKEEVELRRAGYLNRMISIGVLVGVESASGIC